MKSVSLCIKIHLPVIYHTHPFSELKTNDEIYDSRATESYLKKLMEAKLLPFLNSIQNLFNYFGNRFKLALSLSGVSIQLLEKYAPYVLDEILVLSEEGIIDFLLEPWSNSILPYFIEKELILQTDTHRKTIQSVFKQSPSVFLAYSALNSGTFGQFNPHPKCKTTFTCSNQLAGNKKAQVNGSSSIDNKAQFLINHQLSERLQELASISSNENVSYLVTSFIRYIRKHVSLVKPLILIFDPLAQNISGFSKWEKTIALLLNKTRSSFYSLSDLEEVAKYFSIENNYSNDMLSQFNLPDNWMKNNMQNEAFKQFISIYKSLQSGQSPYLPKAWEYLQDINNFFYMSDSFFLDKFAIQHFNPYRSPHEAFTSYMNAINNFWHIKKRSLNPVIKTKFLFSPAIN